MPIAVKYLFEKSPEADYALLVDCARAIHASADDIMLFWPEFQRFPEGAFILMEAIGAKDIGSRMSGCVELIERHRSRTSEPAVVDTMRHMMKGFERMHMHTEGNALQIDGLPIAIEACRAWLASAGEQSTPAPCV